MEPLNRPYERKRISTLGFGLLILLGTTLLADVVFSLLVEFLLPELAGNLDASLWLSSAAQYLAGYPLCMLVISMVPKDKLEKHPWRFRQWGVAFLVSCAILYFGNLLGYEVNRLLGLLIGHAPANVINDVFPESSFWFSLITSVLLAPVLEEIVFRKMLIDRLNRLGDRPAILLSALVFALFHGNFYQFFYAFGVGLVFGYVYCRTGRIRHTIFMHICVNLLFGLLPVMLGEDLSSIPGLIFMIVELVLAIAGIILLIRNARHIKLLRGWIALPRFRWGSLAFFNPGMLIFLLASAAMLAVNLFL